VQDGDQERSAGVTSPGVLFQVGDEQKQAPPTWTNFPSSSSLNTTSTKEDEQKQSPPTWTNFPSSSSLNTTSTKEDEQKQSPPKWTIFPSSSSLNTTSTEGDNEEAVQLFRNKILLLFLSLSLLTGVF
jgi:hypothetical protein